jgi:hypothetical protein
MTAELLERLRPVRQRQLVQAVLSALGWGVLAAAVAALMVAVIRVTTGWTAAGAWAGAFTVAVPLAAALAGGLWAMIRTTWLCTAAEIDRCYGLKDRAVTAVELSDKHLAGDRAGFGALQLTDAIRHLQHVRPGEVIPWRLPRPALYSVAIWAFAVGLLLWPLSAPQASAALSEPNVVILAEAAVVAEDLEKLKEDIPEEALTPEIEELLKKLAEEAKELQEPGVDVKEALATLSEMQAAIQNTQAQFNTELVDQQMKAVGEALMSAESLQKAGQALQEERYDDAAKELQDAEELKMDRKESRSLAERLRKAAKKMQDSGLQSLSEAASQLAEGCENESESQCQGACKKLGQCAGQQACRKKINSLLQCQLAKLGECKGNCQCKKNSLNNGPGKKSNNPSKNFGMASHGGLEGNATKSDVALQREQISGQQGEGGAEVETSTTPEAEQTAQRAYRESYQKYRKMSEAVLETEQIPLGYRQTIRQYFEAIRPANSDSLPPSAE